MTIEQFIGWAINLPYYKGWNFSFDLRIPSEGKRDYVFMAVSGDKCHRYRRGSVEELVVGVKNNIKRIEEENASSA